MSRLAFVWPLLLLVVILLLLEGIISFLFQLILQDSSFQFPLIKTFLNVTEGIVNFIYAISHFFSTFLGVIGGVMTFGELVTAFVDLIWTKPIAVFQAIFTPLESIAAAAQITFEGLIVAGVLHILFQFFTGTGEEVKDIKWAGRRG